MYSFHIFKIQIYHTNLHFYNHNFYNHLPSIVTYMLPLALYNHLWFPFSQVRKLRLHEWERRRHKKPSPERQVAKWTFRQVFSSRAVLPFTSKKLTNQRACSPVLINPCLGFNNWNRILGKLNGFSTKDSLKEKNDYILLNLICEPSGSITFNGTSRTSVPS